MKYNEKFSMKKKNVQTKRFLVRNKELRKT